MRLTPAEYGKFVCDGLASRIQDPAFRRVIIGIDKSHRPSGAQWIQFMNDSVAKRLCDIVFITELTRSLAIYDFAVVAKVMTAPIACGLGINPVITGTFHRRCTKRQQR